MFISLSPFNITTSLPLHGYWYPGIIPFARLRFFWSPLGTSKWPRWDVHAPQWPSAMYCPDGRGGHGGPLVATTWQLITTPTTTTNNDKQRQTTTLWHYQHNGHDKIRVTGSTRQWGGYDLHMFAWNPQLWPPVLELCCRIRLHQIEAKTSRGHRRPLEKLSCAQRGSPLDDLGLAQMLRCDDAFSKLKGAQERDYPWSLLWTNQDLEWGEKLQHPICMWFPCFKLVLCTHSFHKWSISASKVSRCWLLKEDLLW